MSGLKLNGGVQHLAERPLSKSQSAGFDAHTQEELSKFGQFGPDTVFDETPLQASSTPTWPHTMREPNRLTVALSTPYYREYTVSTTQTSPRDDLSLPHQVPTTALSRRGAIAHTNSDTSRSLGNGRNFQRCGRRGELSIPIRRLMQREAVWAMG